MPRFIRRMTSLLLSAVLVLELLPASGLAATDNLLRFQLGYINDNLTTVIAATYQDTAYVLSGVLDGRGVAVEADDCFATIIDPGEDWETTRRYLELRQSKAPLLFRCSARETAPWEWDYSFRAGDAGLKAAGGLLALTEPADAAQYWDTGFFEDDTWVSALRFASDGGVKYLALYVGEGGPYFTVTDALGAELLPCEPAVLLECSHPALTRHDGVDPSCTEAGTATYWSCAACEAAGRDYRFLDERGTREFWDESELSTPPLGHTDGDGDGLCDRCGRDMPVFTRVTNPSEIQNGMTYLLAAEVEDSLHLLTLPDDKTPTSWVVPATAAVQTEQNGDILYQTARDAGALMFRLAEAGGKDGKESEKGGGLEGADYLYAFLCPNGAMLECDGGRGFIVDPYSKYGWRVRLNGAQAEIIPRMMEDTGQYWLRAIRHEGSVYFAACSPSVTYCWYDYETGQLVEDTQDVYASALGIEGETPEYPVYLYIMSGQDVESWDYELTQGATETDFSAVADEAGFDGAAAARSSATGLADAVTDRTAREKIEDYRARTGSTAAHYSLTAYTALTAASYDSDDAETGATLSYTLTHHLTVADGSGEPITYALAADELQAASYTLTLYSWHDPAQIAVTGSFLMGGEDVLKESGLSYRREDDPLFGEGRLTTLSFAREDGMSVLACTDLPIAARLNATAVIEPHEHEFNWDYPDYLQKLVIREDGHYLKCERCDEPVRFRGHNYELFQCSFELTDTSVGEYVYHCQGDGCLSSPYYETREAIDPADWAWVHIVDQFGDTVPQSFGMGGTDEAHYIGGAENYYVIWYKGAGAVRELDKFDPEYCQGSEALHCTKRRIGDSDAPLQCIVCFTEGGRLRYKVPREMVFNNVVPGQAIHIDVTRRGDRSMTVTGRLPDYLVSEEWHVREAYLKTEFPEITYFHDVTIRGDGSFTVTAPYAYSELHFSLNNGDQMNWRSRSLILRSVQSMGEFDENSMTIDLGELDFENHDCCDRFKMTITDEVAANAARSAYLSGTFTLTNETTGASWSKFQRELPDTYMVTDGGSPYDTSGPFTFTLIMKDGYTDRFAVGDELTLTCDLYDKSFDMDPYTFTLDNRTDGRTQLIEPTFYRRGGVRIDTSEVQTSYYQGWWSLIFDSEGNRLMTDASGACPLEPGEYTYLAYLKNNYVDLVDDPDAMERLGIPAFCYYKREVTVVRGEYVTLQPILDEFSKFDPYKNVVVTATVGENLRTGESVPIYIHYKGFDTDYIAALGEYTMNVIITGGRRSDNVGALPLVMQNGRYATWDNEEPLTEEMSDSLQGPHVGFYYIGLKLTAHAPEGTICVYAVPEGETIYITATSSAANDSHESSSSFAVTVPANKITVQSPPSFTSESMGELIYFANLPKNEHGYIAKIYRDGVEGQWEYVKTSGLGQNSIAYTLGEFGGGTWYHALNLEIFAITAVDENGWWSNDALESVWRSPTYHVALNQRSNIPQPSRLTINTAFAGSRSAQTINLKSNDSRLNRMTFLPKHFNEDGTLNQELVFDYRLTMDHADVLVERGRSVYMTVYCGENHTEPFLEQLTLVYNEHTGTFDGTLTFDAGTLRLDDLPYGYTFYYDFPEPNQEDADSTRQAVELIKRYASDYAARQEETETPETPELVDLDALETILADDDFEDWEKDIIRALADYQNTTREVWLEFLDYINETCVTRFDAEFWVRTFMAMGSEGVRYDEEILNVNVSEEALLAAGFQKAETELGDYFAFAGGYGGKLDALIVWNDDPTQRIHRWKGVSRLPQGTPLPDAEEDGTGEDDAENGEAYAVASSTLLFASRSEVQAAQNDLEDFYTNEYIPVVISYLSVREGVLANCYKLINKMPGFTFGMLEEHGMKVIRANNKKLNALSERVNRLDLKLTDLDREIKATRTKFNQKYSVFMEDTILIDDVPKYESELQQMRSTIQNDLVRTQKLRCSLQATDSEMTKLSNSSKLWERIGAIAKSAKDSSQTIRGAMSTVGKYMGPILTCVCCLFDVVNYWTAMNEFETTKRAEEGNRKTMDSIRANMSRQASDPCVDRTEASRQYEKCDEACDDYFVASYKYVQAYAAKTMTTLLMICADVTAIMALVTGGAAAGATAVGAGTVGVLAAGANGWASFGSNMYVLYRYRCLESAEHELTEQCIDPLPFKRRPGCGEEPPAGGSPPAGREPRYPVPPAPVIDPSGYAYEAVASNRVEGVTATIWYKDAYGEEAPWEDAPLYEEVYEQTTGSDGRYEWMTPPGRWKVKLSKDGYLDADSSLDPAAEDGWLPVPPPQMNVNIAMTAEAAPTVKSAAAAPDRVRVVFSQYMTADTAQAVSVTQDGQAVAVQAAFTDLEESPTAEGTFYGSVLELTRTDGGVFSGENLALSVSGEARNYAGAPLSAAVTELALDVRPMVAALSHVYPNRFVTDYNDTESLVITVRDTLGEVMAGVPVTVTHENGGTLQFAQTTVTSDSAGRAVFSVTGVASGYDVLTFTADAVSTRMNTRVKPLSTESPKKPTANLTDGQTVAAGTTLALTCATEGAVIYYTTDDTCPCQESENRRLYTEAIPITETTLFRVASYTETGGYSERLNLRLYVDAEQGAAGFLIGGSGSTVHNLTLDGGQIGVNFFVDPKGTEVSRLAVGFAFDGKTVAPAALSTYQQDDATYYRASCYVNSKQMAKDITAALYLDGEPTGQSDIYSVQAYYHKMSGNEALPETTRALINAIVTYGSCAERFFDGSTSSPAPTELTPIPDEFRPAAASGVTPDGVTVRGCTLLLDTDTYLRLYFDLAEGKTIADYTFTVDGARVTPMVSANANGGYYLTVKHIQSYLLHKPHTFAISDGVNTYSRSYGPLNYAYNKQNSDVAELVKALYQYYLAASAYKLQ